MTAADTSVRPTAAANWRALGTSVRLVTTDPALLDSCNLLLARQLAEVDAACSRFRDDSELVALDSAGGRPVRVSPLLAEALAVALRAAAATDGAVDPTVGSAMNAIGYDRDFRLVQEDGRPVKLTVRPVPGWRLIRLDRATGTVTVPAGVRLDLGATAKAWAADRAAVTLARVAGCGVLVSLGGDTAVAGEPPAGGWRIRVQDVTGPVDETPPQGPYATVGLRGGGLATSGTTARAWRSGPHILHHILDPDTGLPADSPWRTVSVAAITCADANAASTAALIKGTGAERWLSGLGLPARLVARDGTVVTTPGWPTTGTPQFSPPPPLPIPVPDSGAPPPNPRSSNAGGAKDSDAGRAEDSDAGGAEDCAAGAEYFAASAEHFTAEPNLYSPVQAHPARPAFEDKGGSGGAAPRVGTGRGGGGEESPAAGVTEPSP
ncbi:FAD:protein FMN transferase [Streptomyces phaeochromogenes]|uniref:FAD:protein FMN transferase n=1 Tax=Streptomyces phaeochromogenes TaxID=1923 RepID=UPI0036CEF066